MSTDPRCERVTLPDGTTVLARTTGKPLTDRDLAALAELADTVRQLPRCPGCGGPITPRYRAVGVCRNCYGTTDDPKRGER